MNSTPLDALVRDNALARERALLERPIGISPTERATDTHGQQVA
ncbi:MULTISPECIES: hypothetical protein [Nocardia]|nr:hypothetical protein [Nocardia abscessus]